MFDRIGTGITLNENGKILYNYANSILLAYDNALQQIADKNKKSNNVSLSMTAATYFLPELILTIKEKLPHINLAIRQDSPESSKNISDLYLYSSLTPLSGDNVITLLSEPCVLGISKDNPLSKLDKIAPRSEERRVGKEG